MFTHWKRAQRFVLGVSISMVAMGCSGFYDHQKSASVTTPTATTPPTSSSQRWSSHFGDTSNATNRNIEIKNGETIEFDPQSANINKLLITNGTFRCINDGVARTLITTGIIVKGPEARFECDLSRFDSGFSLQFRGSREFTAQNMRCSGSGHDHDHTTSGSGQQSFLVLCGATLSLKGADRGRSWQLAANNQELTVNNNDDDDVGPWIRLSTSSLRWQVGDTIVIAPSMPEYPSANEPDLANLSSPKSGAFQENQILAIDTTNMRIQLANPLSAPVNSRLMSGYLGGSQFDQRVEIANLTRNIKISGTVRDQQKSYHLMFMEPGSIQIESVEFIGGGHQGVMARYPIHWHIAGNRPGDHVKKSSIHDTQQRCITIHGTNRVRLEDNVCYRHVGHGFFLEDGDEINNNLKNNLAMKGLKPPADKALLRSDIDSGSKRFPAVAGFWIANPNNLVHGNAAVGEGTGFWYALKNTDGIAGTSRISSFLPLPTNTPIALFNNNRAHSNRVGLSIDGGPNKNCAEPDDTYVCGDEIDPMHPFMTNYEASALSYIDNFTAFKNTEFGLWVRAPEGNTVVRNSISGDNFVNYGLVFDQLLKESVVVGKSANLSERGMRVLVDKTCTNCSATPDITQLMVASGLVLYDGPLHLQNVEFADYPESLFQRLPRAGLQSHNIAPLPFVLTDAAAVRSPIHKAEGVTYQRAPGVRGDFAYAFGHTSKDNWAAGLYDIDGSISGSAAHTIKPNMPMNVYPRCQSSQSLRNALICPGTFGLFGFAQGIVKANLRRYDTREEEYVDFFLNRQPHDAADANKLTVNQLSFSHDVGARYEYIINLTETEPFDADAFVTYGQTGQWSPWFQVNHPTRRCEITGLDGNPLPSANVRIRDRDQTTRVITFRIKHTELDRRTHHPHAYKGTFRIRCL